MKIKYHLLFVFLFAVIGILSGQEKPNIIIFISDDQNQIDVGCYGNEDVHTPNMDKLASEGMKFNKAYAASPMCTPSRSNMLTGLYPSRNGSQHNHFAVKPNIKTLPDYLKPLGYRVVIAGKTHFKPKSAFDFEYIGQYFGKYLPVENRNDPKKVSVNFIKKHFSSQPQKPLCLIVAPWLPHVPWFPNKDFDPEELHVPEYLVDTKETRQALANYYQTISVTDQMIGEIMEAVEKSGEKDNTVFMFFSDQGAQFPAAKWTTYDQGLRIPFIVRWPEKIKAGSTSDALISLTDLTPTLIDLAGGDPVEGLDGESFVDVLLGEKKKHHDYIFAETSMELHYWYNYTPARTIITEDGYHYIRNYAPGVRFITHIDAFDESNYFGSWIKAASKNEKAEFLVNRYSYRPPEELYYLQEDKWEFKNLVDKPEYRQQLVKLRNILNKELVAQGETEQEIVLGQLPNFNFRSYEITQGISAHPMSFDKNRWNPHTLFITGYIEGLQEEGVLVNYFNQFTVFVKDKKLGIIFNDGQIFYSDILIENEGHLVMRLTEEGEFELKLNGEQLLMGNMSHDYTKINGGYVSVGFIRDEAPPSGIPIYFPGQISNMRFTMNTLNGSH